MHGPVKWARSGLLAMLGGETDEKGLESSTFPPDRGVGDGQRAGARRQISWLRRTTISPARLQRRPLE